MSLDTCGHIPREITVEMVCDCVKTIGGQMVDIRQTGMPGYCLVIFVYNERGRQLNIHMGSGWFGSHKLTMGADEDGQYIVREVVERFSGLFQPKDSEDTMEGIEGAYNESNALFVLRWAIAKGYVDDSKAEDVAEAERRFQQEIRK